MRRGSSAGDRGRATKTLLRESGRKRGDYAFRQKMNLSMEGDDAVLGGPPHKKG